MNPAPDYLDPETLLRRPVEPDTIKAVKAVTWDLWESGADTIHGTTDWMRNGTICVEAWFPHGLTADEAKTILETMDAALTRVTNDPIVEGETLRHGHMVRVILHCAGGVVERRVA